jgi:membrane associated rhomboid family serine protease
MNNYRPSLAGGLPVVVKNLLIINGLMFLLKSTFGENDFGRNLLDHWLGMFHPGSPHFRPWQLLTHMFMHADMMHLLVNMFALFMFGAPVERAFGSARFLTYYLVCGAGAAALHLGVQHAELLRDLAPLHAAGASADQVKAAAAAVDQAEAGTLLDGILGAHRMGQSELLRVYWDYQSTMVGASGAVFGLLLAFGMLFPNTEILLLLPPIPIKAKYFVVLYGLLELYGGLRGGMGDNVAHFAHLGGMLFGYLLLRHWKRKQFLF